MNTLKMTRVGYCVKITDPAGSVTHGSWSSHKKAMRWAKREIAAAKKRGIKGLSFRVERAK